MYKSISLTNFRRFKELKDLELGAINFFVGPNNSGKSTVVKAIQLINKFTSQKEFTYFDLSELEENYQNILNWERIFHKTKENNKNEISMSFRYNDEKYQIIFTAASSDTVLSVTTFQVISENFDLNFNFDSGVDEFKILFNFFLDENEVIKNQIDFLHFTIQLLNLQLDYNQSKSNLRVIESKILRDSIKSPSSDLDILNREKANNIINNLAEKIILSRKMLNEFFLNNYSLDNDHANEIIKTLSKLIKSLSRKNKRINVNQLMKIVELGNTFIQIIMNNRSIFAPFQLSKIELKKMTYIMPFYEDNYARNFKRKLDRYQSLTGIIDSIQKDINELEIIIIPLSSKDLETMPLLSKRRVSSIKEIEDFQNQIEQTQENILCISKTNFDKPKQKCSLEIDIDIFSLEEFSIQDIVDHAIDVNLGKINHFEPSPKFSTSQQALHESQQQLRKRTKRFVETIKQTRTFKIDSYSHKHCITYHIAGGQDPLALTIHKFHKLSYSRLNEFVNKWLKIFEIGEKFKIVSLGGDAYHVLIKDKSGRAHLADKGKGSIQIVYLLLNLISAVEQSRIIEGNESILIIIEEPEVNLHPSLQSKLTELFYDFTSRYKVQLIIETHSEYIIRQSQVIVNKSDENPFTTTYFESDSSKPPYQMIYRKDGIFENEFGTGFFDTSANQTFEIL